MLLIEKTKIRNIELNNRIIRSALWMSMADKDGHISSRLYKVYDELSKGGLGMIITGYSIVDPNDRPNSGMMGIYDDSFIEEHKKLVDIVHSNGTPISIQLAYGGSQTSHPDFQNEILFGPSAVKNRASGITPKEMSKQDIKHLIKMFTNAAIRAQKAGYDAVEIHGAHGYLLNQFLAPYNNRRTDEYGGNIENRSRIFVEVIQSIRKATGENFTIMVKMNHDDYMDAREGLVVREAIEVAKILEKAGADLLEISGVNGTSGKGIGPARTKIHKLESQSYYLEPSKQIAAAVNIPVILVGGNRNFKKMQDILDQTDIQYFSIARPLLCEPDLVNKWQEDSDYKPLCVSCNGCYRLGDKTCVVQEKIRRK